VTGLNAAWKTDNWDNQADLSHSEAWRKNRWEADLSVGRISAESRLDVQNGQTPSGATPGFNPANPSIQSGGRLSEQQRLECNGTAKATDLRKPAIS